MKLKIIATNIIIIAFLFLISLPIYAADPSESEQGLGCGGNLGPIAEFLCGLNRGGPNARVLVGEKLNTVISQLIGFLTIVAALYFLFQFIIAGLNWIGSGGDKNSIEAAQKKLTNAVIGIIIVAAAWVIVGVIGKMLGIEILNPGQVLQDLGL